YVADVRIGEADNLACVAWVGENFLVPGERGIENDFASPARACAGGAALKYAPVFERKNGVCGCGVPSYLLPESFFGRSRLRKRLGNHAVAIERSVGEHCLAVDGLARNGTEDAGII